MRKIVQMMPITAKKDGEHYVVFYALSDDGVIFRHDVSMGEAEWIEVPGLPDLPAKPERPPPAPAKPHMVNHP